MSAVPVVRIVWPANAEYGGFVEINESDFDPDKHELFKEEQKEKALTVEELKAALTEKGIAIPEGAKKSELKALLESAE